MLTNKRPFRFIDDLFRQRQHRGAGYQNHGLNTLLCIFFSFSSLIITSVAAATCPTLGIPGYFAISAMLPFAIGFSMVAKCDSMDTETEGWEETTKKSKFEAGVMAAVLLYLVACGFGFKDVAWIASSSWHDDPWIKVVCFGAVVFLGGVVAALGLYLSTIGTVENCDRLTKGLGRGLMARVEVGCFLSLAAAVLLLLLSMDVVLAVKVGAGDDTGVLGLPVGRESRVVGLYVGGVCGCVFTTWIW
jgi:hypothetical protein